VSGVLCMEVQRTRLEWGDFILLPSSSLGSLKSLQFGVCCSSESLAVCSSLCQNKESFLLSLARILHKAAQPAKLQWHAAQQCSAAP